LSEVQSSPSAAKRSSLRVWGTVFGAIALVYVLIAHWVWSASPTVALDPVEQLRKQTPLAQAGQDAWSAYKAALNWTRAECAHKGFTTSPTMVLLQDAAPGTPAWTTAVPILDAHREQLAALRRAAALPALGFVPGLDHHPQDIAYFGLPEVAVANPAAQEFPAISITLPYLGELSNAVQLLRLDALLSAERGNGAQAVDSIAANVQVAQHVREVPVLIGSIVQYRLLTIAAETSVAALKLKADAFKQADLRRLDQALASITPATTKLQVGGERIMMDDILQRLFTDDGAGDGWAIPSQMPKLHSIVVQTDGSSEPGPPAPLVYLGGPLYVLGAPGRAETRSLWDQSLSEGATQSVLPAWMQVFPKQDALNAVAHPEGKEYWPITIVIPFLSTAANEASRARVYATLARTQVALERYRKDNGRWPDALDALVPKYLPTAPRDEFADAALQYSLVEGKPRVGSVGKRRAYAGESDDVALSR
jgi:hypothetical protein